MRKFGLLLVMLLTMAAVSAGAREAAPTPPAGAKCPVCGMFVDKYPNWVSVLTFKGGERVYFDGVKDLCRYYLDLKKYRPSGKPADVVQVTVREYYHLRPIDGTKAYYVLGSDVYGPMGHELIPLASPADASEFMQDHRGTRILRFREITPAILGTLE
ncbi:nitrous oxide reductase accessory protein NosL [Geotalea uraniireducens]|uniref:Nitrous oxide reductase accessory protein NosL n=1 Tax=Geotalea uraniireducens TaxID=351604 RepID=A0ABN6VVZ8_9BACT|nr:nitrous oxide reductase accessory protein NosL [Geotalea uraniireducens]BDV42387.1 nitrous oxide reductase accessory protein NosL [Geotalea uraniireducens]